MASDESISNFQVFQWAIENPGSALGVFIAGASVIGTIAAVKSLKTTVKKIKEDPAEEIEAFAALVLKNKKMEDELEGINAHRADLGSKLDQLTSEVKILTSELRLSMEFYGKSQEKHESQISALYERKL